MHWPVEGGENLEYLCPCKGYVRPKGRWGAAGEWRRRTAKIRFVKKYCVGEIAKRSVKEGIRAARAALDIAEEWHVSGKRPNTDGEEEEKGRRRLSGLKPILKVRVDDVKKSEWKKIRFCMDSGSGETVVAEEDLPEVETKESWGSKHGQKYEVANGAEISNT